MKKLALVFILALMFNTTAMGIDIAIFTYANWWSQSAADREMQEIADNVTDADVQIFTQSDEAALADWAVAHTGDGKSDLLILCGQSPGALYPLGNTQPDGSIMEEFLDDGNTIINTGDWMFYFNSSGNNGTAGMVNIMDLDTMTERWDDNVPVTVTAEGQLYCPSMVDFTTDRAMHMNLLGNGWVEELSLALAADGVRADPGVVYNTETGGRIGIFYEVANEDNLPRGEVISEWINNWYLPAVGDPKLAQDPTPDKEAVDVPREVALGWLPGQYAATHDVYFGTSFEDVNNASRTNALGALASRGQAAATYDPDGLLDFNTTYYWRIDEVNAAPDSTIFRGDVWTFTTEPFAYAVQNVVATSNASSEASAGPENTVNGSGLNAQDQHSVESGDMWLGVPGADPVYVQYEFDGVYKLHEMLVWNYNVSFELMLGFGLKVVTIEYSSDGAEWVTLGDFEFAQATARGDYVANTTVDFGDVAVKAVRITVNSGHGMLGQFGLSEVRFMYIPAQAREPEPTDGATGVSVETMLSWRAGRDAETHELYLGTDPEALTLSATPAAASYDPGTLDLETTYSWKVDEVNPADATPTWAGDVWSFTTQVYLVVEDFEGYNDDLDASTAIFQTWIDGWENGTGSTVGHIDSPFAEQTIVHGGRQAMPLFYDNVGLTTAEAEYTFEAQDWTASGIQSLSLFFAGDTANSGGQLYLKINNTRVDYDGDAADLTVPLYQAWNVDLSSVGGNLAGVTKLTIGIEGAGAAGILYVDDIRLYPRAVEYITPTEPDSATLVGHWSLDGNANDSSGNGYHGTEINGPTYLPGVNGQAIKFDGVDDYVDFGGPADWPAGTAPRSMCAWLRTNSVDAGYRFAVSYGTAGTSQAMFIGINADDLYGGAYGDDLIVADFWVMGEWHHIALTYDGTTARLYADAVEIASAARNWNLVVNRAHIGQQVNDLSEFWNGSVDDACVYSSALSPAEIAWLAGRTVPMHKPF